MIKEGAIGLAFKFFDLVFNVVSVFWVVAELGVVRTYARTSNVTNYPNERDQTKQTNKQHMKINFYFSKINLVV